MIRFILSLFGLEDEKKRELNEIKRPLVQMLSSGNINLRLGSYITENEINRIREVVLNHNFLN